MKNTLMNLEIEVSLHTRSHQIEDKRRILHGKLMHN